MKSRILTLPLVLVLLLSSCTTVESGDLIKWGAMRGVQLSCDGVPAGGEPISIISAQMSGFYLFGAIPIVSVTLDETLDRFVKEAKRVGADGVACMTFEYQPADAFRFFVFPIPDWSARVILQGTAYRVPKAAANSQSKLSAADR